MTDITDLPLVRTRKVGSYTIHALEAGLQRLDGGAMFGVVPKPLWERRIPADDRNRIPLGLRCLLVETPDALVLVDTGVGNKEDAKFHGHLRYPERRLAHPARGRDPGGGTRAGGRGRGRRTPTCISTTRVETPWRSPMDGYGRRSRRPGTSCRRPSSSSRRSRTSGSGPATCRRTYSRCRRPGCGTSLEGDVEVVPGIRVMRTPGHTPHHQSVVIRSEDETACFLADLIPTAAHLPLPWIMGYDVEPLVTLESKRSLHGAGPRRGVAADLRARSDRPLGPPGPLRERPTLSIRSRPSVHPGGVSAIGQPVAGSL